MPDERESDRHLAISTVVTTIGPIWVTCAALEILTRSALEMAFLDLTSKNVKGSSARSKARINPRYITSIFPASLD
jgi:hypothetical protein